MESLDLLRALSDWACTTPNGLRSGGNPSGLDHIQLHARPDPRGPEVQLTFRAQLIDGRPVIAVSRSPLLPSERPARSAELAHVVVQPANGEGSDNIGRDPGAVCESCGAAGTVGRAARTDASGAVTEMHRFCAACWPEQAARYRARWEEEDRRRGDAFLRGRDPVGAGAGPGMWFQAATWHTTLELVRQIERSMIAPIPPMPGDLAWLCAEIREHGSAFEGEMPMAVEAFLQRHELPNAQEPQ